MLSVLFVLPVSGGSGGAHSVMQEADAMSRFGCPAGIAVNAANVSRVMATYRDFPALMERVFSFANPADLASVIAKQRPSAVVATTNQSVHTLQAAMERVPERSSIRVAYYIQDYEPLFYERDSDEWLQAYQSYTLIPGMVRFAKTRWLQQVVEDNHGVPVSKVEPSIDHAVYYPNMQRRLEPPSEITVVAMIRPSTPRRAPRRTGRILSRIAHEFAARASCITFGCEKADLAANSIHTGRAEHLGVLSRQEVGRLMRRADLFLDLSDYQAFGRTAIEAMACGAVSVVPVHGGVFEFAEHGRNCLVVDTRHDDEIMAAVRGYFAMSAEERRGMSLAAIEAGFAFNPEKAALSEIQCLGL
ncbi:MAG: glycosyltransferase [Alsobacter sp.]